MMGVDLNQFPAGDGDSRGESSDDSYLFDSEGDLSVVFLLFAKFLMYECYHILVSVLIYR